MSEHYKCAVCGTLIDSETGENYVSKDSNAYKIETMKEKLEELQHNLQRVMEENERLREGKPNGDKTSGAGEEINGSGEEGDPGGTGVEVDSKDSGKGEGGGGDFWDE